MMMHEKPLRFDMEDFTYGTSMPDDWEDYEQEVTSLSHLTALTRTMTHSHQSSAPILTIACRSKPSTSTFDDQILSQEEPMKTGPLEMCEPTYFYYCRPRDGPIALTKHGKTIAVLSAPETVSEAPESPKPAKTRRKAKAASEPLGLSPWWRARKKKKDYGR